MINCTFMVARLLQTTTPCLFRHDFTLLQGYVRVGYSPQYIYYELLINMNFCCDGLRLCKYLGLGRILKFTFENLLINCSNI